MVANLRTLRVVYNFLDILGLTRNSEVEILIKDANLGPHGSLRKRWALCCSVWIGRVLITPKWGLYKGEYH